MPVAVCFDEMTGMLATRRESSLLEDGTAKPPASMAAWPKGGGLTLAAFRCHAPRPPFRGFAAVMHDAGRARALVAWPSPWRAIATRYEKTASSFMGVLCLAAALDWLKP